MGRKVAKTEFIKRGIKTNWLTENISKQEGWVGGDKQIYFRGTNWVLTMIPAKYCYIL